MSDFLMTEDWDYIAMSLKPANGIYASHPSLQFKVGDLVSVQWTPDGPVKVHRINAIWRNVPHSATGTMFRFDGRRDWVDSSWCWVDGLEV